jgi:itaconyl-CoA hydratase
MAMKPGWTGRVFEDFAVGDVYEHPLGRTILPADNVWFSCMTLNANPIHFDAEYAGRTEFKKPLVNSCLTLALVTGQSTIDLTMNAVANLSWDEVRMPNPLFEGDTVYSRSEVLDARESKSRPAAGIVQVKTTGINQHGATVIEFRRTFMVWKRGHGPAKRPTQTP